MKVGKFHRKLWRRLNLTRPANSSSLIVYVEPTPLHPARPVLALAFRAGPTESHHSRLGGSDPGGGIPDASGGSPQRGRSDPGRRLLRAVSTWNRAIEGVARHGTAPASGLETRQGRAALRANSSAGSERLPYTQDVGGSNPSSPTATPRRAGNCRPQWAVLFGRMWNVSVAFGRTRDLCRGAGVAAGGAGYSARCSHDPDRGQC